MKLLILLTIVALTAARPGLLRVPKVYNAVITSNQNLSPSRAFPVIQPVIHRTAIGYVPPIYYTQVAPQFSGPEVVHLSAATPKSTSVDDIETAPSSAVDSAKSSESHDKEDTLKKPEDLDDTKNESKKKPDEQVPLSFYPNYQSLYYDPYFYTYNGFNPHLVPGTYYVDYQPYGALDPIPASTPKEGHSGRLLPSYHEEKKAVAKDEKETIPDVPPPPLPTAVPKSS